jgi:DNA-binding transcriptional regulator YhcF (GntR family)
MQAVYEQMRRLENGLNLSKHEQLVQGLIHAIDQKVLVKGDMLPSVNSLMKEFSFARETIARGYKELMDRGIVESKNRIGFFVASTDTGQQLRVALVLFAFDSFQETFYKTFRNRLGTGVHIDVFFHHNNIDVLESMIASVRGKYGMYVVAPIPHARTKEILATLPVQKLLMIDRYEPLAVECSYVTQEFERSTYRILMELADTVQEYGSMIYYHRPNADTPEEILRAYKKFVKTAKIKSEIRPEYIPGSIEKGHVYFTINNVELWAMLKDCKTKKLKLGKDVGILSHNDDLVKEIICDGITTYSTDFIRMAERAAEFVLTSEKMQEIIPTVLIRRKSI